MPMTSSVKSPSKREIRNFTVANVEAREDSSGITLDGYASVFDTPYEVYGFKESIRSGAFAKTLQEQADVRLLLNHGDGAGGMPLARTKSGTMTLNEDSRGLKVLADLEPTDPDVQALIPKMKRGDVDQMSFAFRVIQDDWNSDMTERSISEVRLYDVSVVTFPASPTTTVSLRQLDQVCDFFGVAPEQIAAILEMRAAGKELNDTHFELLKSLRSALDEVLITTTTNELEDDSVDDSWKFKLHSQLISVQ